MYESCDEEGIVSDYVQNKCNGKQSCEYKFYKGETPFWKSGDPIDNKKYRGVCNGLSRYVIVPYGCSRLAGTKIKPTKPPQGTHFFKFEFSHNFF